MASTTALAFLIDQKCTSGKNGRKDLTAFIK